MAHGFRYIRLAGFLALLLAVPQPASAQSRSPEEQMKKLTPVLYVESIEPALPFWEERLGFERTVEVPQGDRLGFLTLANGGVEVMYQTRASVAEDLPQLVDTPVGGTLLFIVVDDLDAIEVALEGIEFVQDRRTTSYGATEIVVREPAGGNAVVFAEFAEDSEES